MDLRKRLAKLKCIQASICIVTVMLMNSSIIGYAQENQTVPESESSPVSSVPGDPETDSGQKEEKTADLPEEASSEPENQEEGEMADGEEAEPEQSSLMSAQEQQPSLTSAPEQQDEVTYDYNADLYAPESSQSEEQPGGDYPGVYSVKIDPNQASEEDAPTIGMPSIADQNLDEPTTESPAIIQGAAVGYEEKTGPVDYTTIKERTEPYSEFEHSVTEEKAQDGSVHKKLSGFDGTYVISPCKTGKQYGADPRHGNDG